MAVGPSGGMMKKLFDPANMKKKNKNALSQQKQGGNKPSRPEMPPSGAKAGKQKLFADMGD